MAPCPGGGLSRGYRTRHDGTGAEFFAAGPPYETQRPTRWPMGVRGNVFKMTIQAFLRSCLRLHDDLLGILEVALDLPDDELAACWARQNGEVRLGSYPMRAGKPSKKEGWEPDEDEGGHGKVLFTLVFQEKDHDEVVLFCGPALNKWLGKRPMRDPRCGYDATDDHDSEPKWCTYGLPSSSQYSISFTGYEDMTIAC